MDEGASLPTPSPLTRAHLPQPRSQLHPPSYLTVLGLFPPLGTFHSSPPTPTPSALPRRSTSDFDGRRAPALTLACSAASLTSSSLPPPLPLLLPLAPQTLLVTPFPTTLRAARLWYSSEYTHVVCFSRSTARPCTPIQTHPYCVLAFHRRAWLFFLLCTSVFLRPVPHRSLHLVPRSTLQLREM